MTWKRTGASHARFCQKEDTANIVAYAWKENINEQYHPRKKLEARTYNCNSQVFLWTNFKELPIGVACLATSPGCGCCNKETKQTQRSKQTCDHESKYCTAAMSLYNISDLWLQSSMTRLVFGCNRYFISWMLCLELGTKYVGHL